MPTKPLTVAQPQSPVYEQSLKYEYLLRKLTLYSLDQLHYDHSLQPAYGQQCNRCRGDYVDPFEWEPLKCGKCGSNTDCNCKKKIKRHKSHLCQRCHSEGPCHVDVNRKPYRVFGWFECSGCNNEWPSAYTWVELSHCGNEVVSIGLSMHDYLKLIYTVLAV